MGSATNTSTKSRIVLGAALVVLALSVSGAIDLFPVQAGVTSVKKG